MGNHARAQFAKVEEFGRFRSPETGEVLLQRLLRVGRDVVLDSRTVEKEVSRFERRDDPVEGHAAASAMDELEQKPREIVAIDAVVGTAAFKASALHLERRFLGFLEEKDPRR